MVPPAGLLGGHRGDACVTRHAIWDALSGIDEESFAVSCNDVDYCLRVREAGYLVVWTPYARLLHETSVSQRANVEVKAVAERNARFAREKLAMFRKWLPQIAFDPAYNRNLSSNSASRLHRPGQKARRPGTRVSSPRTGSGLSRRSRRLRRVPHHRAELSAAQIADFVHGYETIRLMMPPEIARMAPDSVVFQRQLEPGQIEVIRVGQKYR